MTASQKKNNAALTSINAYWLRCACLIMTSKRGTVSLHPTVEYFWIAPVTIRFSNSNGFRGSMIPSLAAYTKDSFVLHLNPYSWIWLLKLDDPTSNYTNQWVSPQLRFEVICADNMLVVGRHQNNPAEVFIPIRSDTNDRIRHSKDGEYITRRKKTNCRKRYGYYFWRNYY